MAKLPDQLLSWREREQRLTLKDARYSPEAFFACKAPYLGRWLEQHNPHHPRVVVWGAGRASRRRLQPLIETGVEVEAYVDIDPKKIGWRVGGAPVLAPRPSFRSGGVLCAQLGRQARRSRTDSAGPGKARILVGCELGALCVIFRLQQTMFSKTFEPICEEHLVGANRGRMVNPF